MCFVVYRYYRKLAGWLTVYNQYVAEFINNDGIAGCVTTDNTVVSFFSTCKRKI